MPRALSFKKLFQARARALRLKATENATKANIKNKTTNKKGFPTVLPREMVFNG